MEDQTRSRRSTVYLLRFLKDRFNLDMDKASQDETIDYIRKGVEFRGPNLWILIFAILIASIGLNVNSTAVVIGAMLISPLMGPILGIGVGTGTNDWELLKLSVKNLLIATIFSIITSTIYFLITPLGQAQSELLSRTTPTIWDVLIGFFGGLAGIVAGSRKDKSNAIPGVAIATALMPPLCTAGYGLAKGNFYFFLGAFYLYFINSVCIILATLLIVRFLKYRKKQFDDPAQERRVKSLITISAIITIIPSIYLGYQVVDRSIFQSNAQRFINQELTFENARCISHTFDSKKPRKIEVTLFGDPVSEDIIDNVKSKMPFYGLGDTKLVVFQGHDNQEQDVSQIESNVRTGIIEDLYKQNELDLKSKDERIKVLEDQLVNLKVNTLLAEQLSPELKALYPQVNEFSIDRTLLTHMDSLRQDTVYMAYMKFKTPPHRSDLKKIENWLKARVKSDQVQLVVH